MTRTSLTEFASLTAEQREVLFSCRHERKDAVGRDGNGEEEEEEEEGGGGAGEVQPEATLRSDGLCWRLGLASTYTLRLHLIYILLHPGGGRGRMKPLWMCT